MNHCKRHTISGFVFLAASAVTWAAVTSAAEPPPATSSAESVKPASYDVALRSNVRVAMRDGVELSTYICLPKAPGEKFPVILLRTPYGKGTPFRSDASKKLASRGYVVVVQYCRGRGESDGEWEPMVNEMADGLLVDVHPDGRPINLCDGIIRARYRESAAKPTLIKPGKIYRYEIDLWATSNVFLPGHRIRVEISSSNFPRFDRNPNTGHPFGKDAELNKAKQTVYHDSQHPSHVLLPIIPP